MPSIRKCPTPDYSIAHGSQVLLRAGFGAVHEILYCNPRLSGYGADVGNFDVGFAVRGAPEQGIHDLLGYAVRDGTLGDEVAAVEEAGGDDAH